MYATINEVRELTGITATDMDDCDLEELIELATQMIIRDLTIRVVDEEPSGVIDGENNTFRVYHYPIADINGDKVVNGSDINVYTWTNSSDPSTKSSVAVSTVYPNDGIIVLQSAPSTSVKKITVDYSYQFESTIDWSLIKVACAYLTAFLFAVKKFTTVPESVSRGPIRFRYYTKPYDEYLKRYYEVMELVKSKHHVKKSHSEMSLVRGVLE